MREDTYLETELRLPLSLPATASVRPEDIDVPKTRIVKKVVRKTFTDPSGYLGKENLPVHMYRQSPINFPPLFIVSEEVEEEEEVELAPEEIEAERKRVAAKMNRQAAPAAPTGAAGKSKSASAPASGAKKQASLMSFFGKK